MKWKVGDTATLTRQITAADIKAFADLVGDHNPIHLDSAYAATTPFKRCIAHGMLGTSLISTVLATKMPGPGTIYLGQSVQFKKPVFVDDTVTVTLKITKAREDKPIFTMESSITNQNGELVVVGETTALAPL